MSGLGDSAIAKRLIALALFFAYASLRENASALCLTGVRNRAWEQE
jgi:hypothetical protein